MSVWSDQKKKSVISLIKWFRNYFKVHIKFLSFIFPIFFLFRNDILTEELECQLTTSSSVTSQKEDNSDSDLDLD